MKSLTRAASRLLLAAVACLATAGAHADGAIGDKLPADFPVILDASLGDPVIGFGAAGKADAHAGDVRARQQRHSLPDRVQPVRPRAGVRAVSSRTAATPRASVGRRLPGRPVRLARSTRRFARSGPHRLCQRARRARFRPRGARVHGAQQVDIVAHSLGSVIVREWLRKDPRRGRLVRRVRRDRRPEPRDHQLLAESAELLAGAVPRRLHSGQRGLPGARLAEHAVPEAAEQGPGGAGCRQGHAGDPQCRHELRLLLETGRRVRARACRGLVRAARRLLAQREPEGRARARSHRPGHLGSDPPHHAPGHPQLAGHLERHAAVPQRALTLERLPHSHSSRASPTAGPRAASAASPYKARRAPAPGPGRRRAPPGRPSRRSSRP